MNAACFSDTDGQSDNVDIAPVHAKNVGNDKAPGPCYGLGPPAARRLSQADRSTQFFQKDRQYALTIGDNLRDSTEP